MQDVKTHDVKMAEQVARREIAERVNARRAVDGTKYRKMQDVQRQDVKTKDIVQVRASMHSTTCLLHFDRLDALNNNCPICRSPAQMTMRIYN